MLVDLWLLVEYILTLHTQTLVTGEEFFLRWIPGLYMQNVFRSVGVGTCCELVKEFALHAINI